MKIVVLDGYTLNPGDLSWNELESFGDLLVYDRTPKDMVVERIKDADAVFTNKTVISEDILSKCPNLKYIGVLATGYNVVDVKAANKRNITVTNVPTYGTDAVSQFTIALLLELCHRIGDHWKSVLDGDWTNSPEFCYWNYPLIELSGKTMGIIGFGKIGRGTARIAKALGMKVLAYDRNELAEDALDGLAKQTTFDELLKESDVISLHCPLFPKTEGMINKDSISKMKDGVMIINTARGPLIIEEDLKEALVSGKVAGAAVDVVSSEPIAKDNPLLSAPNIIITPHIAWAPIEARTRLMSIVVDNYRSFIQGKPINTVQ
mgnify:CR=1 FL=1